MDGMADIIPPLPVHGGLTGLIEQSGLTAGGWLSLAALLLTLLLLAWFQRHRLLARWRRQQAQHALQGGRLDEVERLICQHYKLSHLHPASPPQGWNTRSSGTDWRALVEGLHGARFGKRALDANTEIVITKAFLTPSPLTGEGRGEGEQRRINASQDPDSRTGFHKRDRA